MRIPPSLAPPLRLKAGRKEKDMEAALTINDGGKELLHINPDGGIVFNKDDFPNLTADEFAKKFVECVEKMTAKIASFAQIKAGSG